jgi:hypothetical protein
VYYVPKANSEVFEIFSLIAYGFQSPLAVSEVGYIVILVTNELEYKAVVKGEQELRKQYMNVTPYD